MVTSPHIFFWVQTLVMSRVQPPCTLGLFATLPYMEIAKVAISLSGSIRLKPELRNLPDDVAKFHQDVTIKGNIPVFANWYKTPLVSLYSAECADIVQSVHSMQCVSAACLVLSDT